MSVWKDKTNKHVKMVFFLIIFPICIYSWRINDYSLDYKIIGYGFVGLGIV